MQKIELSEKSPKKRLIIVIALVAFALVMIGIGVFSALQKPEGWMLIEPSNVTADSVSVDFVLNYDLGASGESATAEHRELSKLYGELCTNAYKLFHADRGFDGVVNLHYLNTHPGEEVAVDPELYAAFELLDREKSRLLYAAPFYDEYRNMFSSDEDIFAQDFDPYKSTEVASYFLELAAYANDENDVKLELLGNNRVKLTVSEEYRAFAAQYGLTRYIDFYWAKNAFVADYIADALAEKGFVYGFLSSYDGFTRNLDPREIKYSMNIFASEQGKSYAAARYDYSGKNSVVVLRAYSIGEHDEIYYTYKDGTVRHAYVDVSDGLCRSTLDSLISYSKESGCAEVLLKMIPIYIARNLDTAPLGEMAGSGIYSIRCNGSEIVYNQSDAVITPNEFENVKFTIIKED